MGKKVIIAEKPSVAKEFAKVLKINGKNNNGYIESEDYIVTWCVGHLVTMSYPEKYDEKLRVWSLSTLPFIPKEYKYEVIDSVSKQFETVNNILTREDVDTIYVCTDSGREGEYIYRLVDNMCGCPNKEKRRVWIDSQTEEAILNGIKDAKLLNEYDNLSDSAYLRAKEDYLMGINFSRLLSLGYGRDLAKRLGDEKAVISVGRVMTCVLGMIVRREREIRNFKKVSYYKVQSSFKNGEKEFDAEWKVSNDSRYFESPKLYNESGFKKKEDANEQIEYITNCGIKPIVKEVTKKDSNEKPPLLFNLAEIQNECSKRFKISPDETLQVIQDLYERKLVTYPRTDARVLSTAVAKTIANNLNGLYKSNLDASIKKFVDKMIKEKYNIKLDAKSKYVDDSKITDHYAIIPTGQGFENYSKLNPLQKGVFHTIVKRFLCIFYPNAKYSRVSVTVAVDKEEFNASGRVCKDEGYLEVLKIDKDDDLNIRNFARNGTLKVDNLKEKEKEEVKESEEKNDLDVLATLKKGMELTLSKSSIKESETSPPSRYSSGTMILAMENAGKLIEDDVLREQIKSQGIGTSATRAEIIKKLVRIDYININNKTQILTPTKRGEEVFDIMVKTMPDLLNAELTASWEKGLNMVAEGKITSQEFLTKLESYIRNKVVKYKNERNRYLYGY